MTERTCCFIPEVVPGGPAVRDRCPKPAEWELWPHGAVYEHVDACSDHVGHLLDDSPETRVRPLGAPKPRTMGGDPGLAKMR